MNCVSIEVNGISFNMLPVEGGHFLMGATPEQHAEAWDNESPAHVVELDDYYIGETVVTQALWNAVMGEDDDCSEMPQTGKSWQECQSFLSRLSNLTGRNFRMPTEAEWENAARGGNLSKGYKFSGSNDVGDVAWFDMNSGNRIHPVKQKSHNELGLYDMCGNVWEWCSDWYDSYPSNEEEENIRNPKGPLTGKQRVVRGACSTSYVRLCRVSSRTGLEPTGKNYAVTGFRLSMDADEALKSVVPLQDNASVQDEATEPSFGSKSVDVSQAGIPDATTSKKKSSKKGKSKTDKPKKKVWLWIMAVVAIVAAVFIAHSILFNEDEKMYRGLQTIEDCREYVSRFGREGRHFEEINNKIESYKQDSISNAEKQLVKNIQGLLKEAETILSSVSIDPYDIESYSENRPLMDTGWQKLEEAEKKARFLSSDKKEDFLRRLQNKKDDYKKIVEELLDKELQSFETSSNSQVKKESQDRMSVLKEYSLLKTRITQN